MSAKDLLKNTKFKSSVDCNDIDKVMRIVATFGANEENLIKIKDYILKELSELGNNRILYLLEKEFEPIGMVQLILRNADNDPVLANGKDIAHIHSLQISKNQHRNGYGFNLMELLEDEAKKIGISKLTLGVDSDNEKAINLYRKLNYTLVKKQEGRTPEVHLYYMEKILN